MKALKLLFLNIALMTSSSLFAQRAQENFIDDSYDPSVVKHYSVRANGINFSVYELGSEYKASFVHRYSKNDDFSKEKLERVFNEKRAILAFPVSYTAAETGLEQGGVNNCKTAGYRWGSITLKENGRLSFESNEGLISSYNVYFQDSPRELSKSDAAKIEYYFNQWKTENRDFVQQFFLMNNGQILDDVMTWNMFKTNQRDYYRFIGLKKMNDQYSVVVIDFENSIGFKDAMNAMRSYGVIRTLAYCDVNFSNLGFYKNRRGQTVLIGTPSEYKSYSPGSFLYISKK